MEWDGGFLARSPLFDTLRAHAGAFEDEPGWPGLAGLQGRLDRRCPPVRTSSGMPLRLVPQGRRKRVFEEKHEVRVYLRGELELRERSWHDLFNLLVWLAFPRAKAALNRRHYQALEARRAAAGNEALVPSRALESAEVPKVEPGIPHVGAARRANRGPAQDALTLFDEGGVIVASSDQDLLACLRDWRWKDLFWGNRARLATRMRFHVFGHAIYEKALNPFMGITGRGILIDVKPELLAAPLVEQVAVLDRRIAEHVSDERRMAATRELAVVPVLGVPGWHAGNDREEFYDDRDYFRPGRRDK